MCALAVLMAVLASSCAGRDFARPRPGQLALGKTTYADIVRRFGQPQGQGESLRNDQTVKDVAYGYADPSGTAAAPGITPARAMGYYFVRDILVGYEFISTFKADATDFDDTKAQHIRPGATTEPQVVALLGPPGGMYMFPLTKLEGERALVYMYGYSKGDSALVRKHLLVSVDAAGVVRDVQLEKAGE
jgi:hypothetical protein